MPRKFTSYKKRNYGKRYYRRRQLTTANIRSRTGAKSQASQIIALRNRINAISKRDRPEIQLFNTQESKTFTNSTFASTYETYRITPAGSAMTGQWMNSRNINIRGIIEYQDNYDKDVAIDHQRTCSYRFILFSTKTSTNSARSLADVLDISSSGTGYELNAIKPLKKGCSSYVNIIFDKCYTISYQNPIKKFKLSFKRLQNLHRELSDGHPAGEIYFCVICSGLHYDTSYEQKLDFSFISTYAYTDIN